MNRDEINETERNNPGNWSKPFVFYSSKLDSRLWVRKPQPWMGWSLNMAKMASRIAVVLFVIALLAAVAVSAVLVVSFLK